VAFLEQNSRPTARFCRLKKRHRRAGKSTLQEVRTLTASKDELYIVFQESKEWKDLKDAGVRAGRRSKAVASRTAWYKLFRTDLYWFKPGCKRVDICDTCLEFDRKAAVLIRAAVRKAQAILTALVPTYFDALKAEWAHLGKRATLTAHYLREMKSYVSKHYDRFKSTRDELPYETRRDLHSAETDVKLSLKEEIERLSLYEHHWHSVQRQHNKAESLIAELQVGTLLLLYDYKQNISLPLAPSEGGGWWYANGRTQTTCFGTYALWRDEDGTLHHR